MFKFNAFETKIIINLILFDVEVGNEIDLHYLEFASHTKGKNILQIKQFQSKSYLEISQFYSITGKLGPRLGRVCTRDSDE